MTKINLAPYASMDGLPMFDQLYTRARTSFEASFGPINDHTPEQIARIFFMTGFVNAPIAIKQFGRAAALSEIMKFAQMQIDLETERKEESDVA